MSAAMSETKSKPTVTLPKRLSDIEIPPEAVRYSTGIAGLDQCLAESEDGPQGLPTGTSILLSGMPGGGKSTIATFMAAMQTGRDAVIFHGEERAGRVKERWQRLGLKDADPFVIPLRAVEDALDVIRELNSREGGKGIGVAIIDSIQTVTLNGKRKYQDQYEAAEMLVGQICSAGGCAVLVSHVSKTGQDHQGSAALAHLVDIHIHVNANAKKSERKLEVRKNRMGRAGFEVPLNITISGLSVGVPAPLNPGSGMGQARTALEKACETAYSLLLNGERLDGYDFDKANCSGGMWRAGLEMACKRLVRDGFPVVEEKVKGRKGYRLESPPEKGDDGNIVVVTNVMKPEEPAQPVVVDQAKEDLKHLAKATEPQDVIPLDMD
jgi:hypothetical protein